MKIIHYIYIVIAGGIMNVAAELPDDASSISWAHAVNSKKKLEDALAGDIQFLEADVSLGNVTGPNAEIMVPIMAHPPRDTSDISLKTWIEKVISAKKNKGVKLDYKLLSVVEPSLKILRDHEENITFPLWLNADILPGPVNATTTPVNSMQFLSLCQQYFPGATLSVGWTTNFQNVPGSYSWKNVKDMAEALECSKVNQPVTFPIRAVFVASSLHQLVWLLDVFSNSTLTIWSGMLDNVNVDDLLKLRSLTPISKVYYDLPEQLNSQFQSKKHDVHPVVRLPGFKNYRYTIFGDEETCTNKTYVTSPTILFTGQQNGIIFLETFSSKKEVQISGKINFLTSLPTQIHLFISKASAFPQDATSSGCIIIPSDIDVLDVLKNSTMFSYSFSNILNNKQFQLNFYKNSITLNVTVGKEPKPTMYNFTYSEDAVVSFVSEGGPSVIYDGNFTTSDLSHSTSLSANLFLLLALVMFLFLEV